MHAESQNFEALTSRDASCCNSNHCFHLYLPTSHTAGVNETLCAPHSTAAAHTQVFKPLRCRLCRNPGTAPQFNSPSCRPGAPTQCPPNNVYRRPSVRGNVAATLDLRVHVHGRRRHRWRRHVQRRWWHRRWRRHNWRRRCHAVRVAAGSRRVCRRRRGVVRRGGRRRRPVAQRVVLAVAGLRGGFGATMAAGSQAVRTDAAWHQCAADEAASSPCIVSAPSPVLAAGIRYCNKSAALHDFAAKAQGGGTFQAPLLLLLPLPAAAALE